MQEVWGCATAGSGTAVSADGLKVIACQVGIRCRRRIRWCHSRSRRPELCRRFIVGASQERQDLADSASPAADLWKRQVSLDLVAVAAAILVLDDISGLGEISDDAVGGAITDARPVRDVAQSHARVLGDAQQHPGVVGQEAPVRHARNLPQIIAGNLLLVSGCERNVKTTLWASDRPGRCASPAGVMHAPSAWG